LKFSLTLALVLTASWARGQTPDAPKPTTEGVLIATKADSHAADAYFTHWNMSRNNFREHDPLMRPFTRSTPTFVAFSAAAFMGEVWIEHRMRRHGHARLANALTLTSIGVHAEGAVTSDLWRRQ
jgi:hypothetical protein